MRHALSRLRWQLTLSHLIAIAFTLICMCVAAVLIVTLVFTRAERRGSGPARSANAVARAIGGLVARGQSPELDAVLRALADGSLRLQTAGWPFGADASHSDEWASPPPQDISYIAIVDGAGRLLASSDPAGSDFNPPERGAWLPLTASLLAGGVDSAGSEIQRSGAAPVSLGAAVVRDAAGRPVAAAIVASTPSPARGGAFGFWRSLAILGAATFAVLAGASVFALASATVVAYLLSRRLVTRLERLSRAVTALAAGDLDSRVDEGRDDEVGGLARRFNEMAASLQRAVRDLQSERDRVSGLLDDRRHLVAVVSHELRTPVATARGYLESALRHRDGLPAGLCADLETIEREVTRLQRLIDDLFTLSRVEVGRLELRPEPTDVGVVVRQLVDTLAPLAWRQRHVQMIAEAPAQIPRACADPRRLEQLVSNLLSNAVRHTPPGGLVAAVVSSDADAVQVDVRDTGAGIAPEDLPRIFDRFYRGRGGDGQGGAGLGLAVAKELAEGMGGSVQVASAPGEGSCFTVRLPQARKAG